MTGDLTLRSGRVGGQAEFLDLRLTKFDFQLFLDNLVEPPYELQSAVHVRWARTLQEGETAALYLIEFTVSAAPAGGEPVFRSLVEHALAYAVDNDHTDEELQAFGLTSAVFASYPYVRELLQSSTGRAGLEPLILPVWRSFFPDPQGASEDEKKATTKKATTKKATTKKASAKKAPS